MHPASPNRSRLVTIVALLFVGWGGLVLVVSAFITKAWDPGSAYWDHSDHMWAQIYVGDDLTLEENGSLMAAQTEAQIRYELPMKGAFNAWSLVTFVAALGLLRRKNWARLLFIGAMVSAVLGFAWYVAVFTPLYLAHTSDIVECVVVAAVFGWIAWKLRSPSILSEFRNEQSSGG